MIVVLLPLLFGALPLAMLAAYLMPSAGEEPGLPSWATAGAMTVVSVLFLGVAVVVVLSVTGTLSDIVKAPATILRAVFRGFTDLLTLLAGLLTPFLSIIGVAL